MIKIAIAATAALFLSACAGAVPWNPQNYAGVDELVVTFQVPEGSHGPETLRIIGGKEASSLDFAWVTPDGTEMSFSAKEQKAFEGQKIRGAVEDAVSDDVKAAFPGLVDGIVRALTGL